MKTNDGWLNALFALLFIAVPAIVGFYFLLPDWTGYDVVSYGSMWGIGLGFAVYVIIASTLVIYFKILTIDSLNFDIPITLVFVAMFVTSGIPLWGRILLVITCVLLTFPVNILVSK